MPMHIAQRSETLQTIAEKYGFRQWQRIFEHPKNAELRRRRPNPEVLAPGDVVFVPTPQPKIDSARVNEKTVFVLASVRRELVLALSDADGNILSGTPYRLSIGGSDQKGFVDSRGLIRHDVDVDVREATLLLEFDDALTEIVLEIGALDPIETQEGVRARLYNLGYVHTARGLETAPQLQEAMALFRDCSQLPALDDPMSSVAREDLLFAHGS